MFERNRSKLLSMNNRIAIMEAEFDDSCCRRNRVEAKRNRRNLGKGVKRVFAKLIKPMYLE
jgi:hypothetical protein